MINKDMNMKYKILGIVVLAVVAIQFIPYGKEKSNPSVVSEPKWESAKTRKLFFRSCSDCHSHETKWPWYSNIAPISWLVQHDVDEGREHFNVSMWGVQKKNKGYEAVKEVKEGEMPPWIYLIFHADARLSESGAEELIKGLRATFGEKKES